jgi:hypothetical protein
MENSYITNMINSVRNTISSFEDEAQNFTVFRNALYAYLKALIEKDLIEDFFIVLNRSPSVAINIIFIGGYEFSDVYHYVCEEK